MGDCSGCDGAKYVFVGGDGSGPWADKEMIPCPDCKGTGKA